MGVSEDSQQLRRLARAVMSGELTREEYRRQRRVLVDRYAGDVPMTSQPLAAVLESASRMGVEHTVPNTHTTPTVPYRHDTDITMIGGDQGQTRRRQAVVLGEPTVDRRAVVGRGDLWIGAMVGVILLALAIGGLLVFLW